jgi:hypothetical protein
MSYEAGVFESDWLRSATLAPEEVGGRILRYYPEEPVTGGAAANETNEGDTMRLEITKITDGLGVGEGTISGAEIAAAAGPEAMARVDETIQSPSVLVAVDTDKNGRQIDDDGCGDGRFTKLVKRGTELLRRSLNRAKVFGGGSTMATADLIGSGAATGKTLQEAFGASIETMADKMINFGAHTADHAPDGKCGCGAIDEAPKAVSFVPKYRQQIIGQFEALGVSTDGLDDVLDNFTAYETEIKDQSFEGRAVMGRIVETGKIVKQLGGPHIEARIVLNFVPGMTVNQQLIREVSGGKVDVFGVDVWRMQQIAEKLYPQDETAQNRAFQSMLAYTLAVAAVLTKGDLPVYAVTAAPVRTAEPASA